MKDTLEFCHYRWLPREDEEWAGLCTVVTSGRAPRKCCNRGKDVEAGLPSMVRKSKSTRWGAINSLRRVLGKDERPRSQKGSTLKYADCRGNQHLSSEVTN